MRHHYCLFLFFAGLPPGLRAQTAPPEAAVGLSGHLGSFITKMSKADLLKDSYSELVAVEWSRSTAHAPRTRLGAVLLHGNSGSRQYVGAVTALLGFVDRTLVTAGPVRLHARLGIGPGRIARPFDAATNPKNSLLGSHLNAALQGSLFGELHIGRHWSWNAGISFLHLSSGAASLPNLGLNIPALTTGLSYRYAQTPLKPVPPAPPARRAHFETWASAGRKQWPLVNSPRRWVQVLGIEWQRRFSANGRYGAVLQVLRDPTPVSGVDTLQKAPGGGGWQAGIGAQYLMVLGRLEVPVQAGAYLFNKRDVNAWYQTLGVRYRFADRWRAGIHLKTHMGRADYFHAGIGYQW
ncbi:acyloxyacyl hydrolase [Flaviaesturariibacter amylovorans]|uniref:Acyloxyacyl hydrolase n=1 Tax=Flaviaesturariibacter amylovorans TaxID=1084520 RepID=A0ABP8GMF8_9BACT